MKHRILLALTLLWLPVAVEAAAGAPVIPSPTANLFQVLFGLIAVLGLMAGAAWLLKRFAVTRTGAGNPIKIIGGVSVGSRERVLVVEVADQWIVVGVAAGRISSLTTMPRQESAPMTEVTSDAHNFAVWLKRTLDKRNSN